MQIIKLSQKEFSQFKDVKEYFSHELPSRNPAGKFNFTSKKIAKANLDIGDELVFTYTGNVIYIALSASGRLDNVAGYDYPHYLLINMDTVRPLQVDVAYIEDILTQSGDYRHIKSTQAWPRIENTRVAKKVWDMLTASADNFGKKPVNYFSNPQ